MLKKCLPLLCALALTLSGCADSRRIETASVIENVSVHQSQGQLFYTFYLLSDSDRPNAVTVPAASFEEARSLAEEQYIPHLSLAKLELLLLHRDVSPAVMKRDIDYISTQASFSPVAHVALCDQKTLSRLRRDPDAQELIERQIDCNIKIAEEGIKNPYGSEIGRRYIKMYGEDDYRFKAVA